MIKKIVSFGLFLLLTSFNTIDSSVYICGPSGAKRYHYSNTCRGLDACKHKIHKVSLTKARSFGLTICGYED